MPNGADGRLTTRNEADEGGAETHVLTEAELAAHAHLLFGNAAGPDSTITTTTKAPAKSMGASNDFNQYTIVSNDDDATVGLSESKGSGTAHANMQPFTVVGFIMFAGAQAI